MNTIIEKIRAEVERLKKEHQEPTFRGDEYEEGGVNGYQLALDKVLAKLSDLEKSEKPINLETLEEDVKSWFFNEISSKINVEHTMYYYFQECARRYYKLGRQSKKRELLPMIERVCVSCPEKVKAESALNKFISKYCAHCSIEHCPGVNACYTSSNEQLQ